MTDSDQMELSEGEEKLREGAVSSLSWSLFFCQDSCRGGAVEIQVSMWMKMTAELGICSYEHTYKYVLHILLQSPCRM